MKSNDNRSSFFFQKNPWENNANPTWLASTLCMFRNIEKYNFPGKLNGNRKKQIISLLSKSLLALDGLSNPLFIKAENLDFLEKEFISEHFLSTYGFNQAHVGEGFITDDTGEFLASINLKDHIALELLDCKGELENTWARLVQLESNLGKSVNYSFLPKFGFLTSDPTQCGTALIVTVYLQVPGLIHSGKIDHILKNFADDSITVSGIQGNPTEIIGDILMIQNNYTLGITEENIISSIRSFTSKILVEENSARNKIKQENSAEFKDKISRAYGILIYSYQIETIEALNALSLLKFGLEANWVTGIDNKEINKLFFSCRRAHLLSECREKIEQEAILHKRAETIHHALKDLRLTI